MRILQLETQISLLDQQISAQKQKLVMDKAAIIAQAKGHLTQPLTWVGVAIASIVGFRLRKRIPVKKIMGLKDKALYLLVLFKKFPMLKDLLKGKKRS